MPGKGTWKLKDSTGFDPAPKGKGDIVALESAPGEVHEAHVGSVQLKSSRSQAGALASGVLGPPERRSGKGRRTLRVDPGGRYRRVIRVGDPGEEGNTMYGATTARPRAAKDRSSTATTRRTRRSRLPLVVASGLLGGLITAVPSAAQTDSPLVEATIDAMSTEQKAEVMAGVGFFGGAGGAGSTPQVTVTGVDTDVEPDGEVIIPALDMSDGPAGLRLAGVETTPLPSPVGLAASFDTDAAHAFGAVIGNEGAANGQEMLLSPMTNIVRVPEAGRNFETLGEDPMLAGEMLTSEVEGLQDNGMVATIKHYTANNFENQRQQVDETISERALREIYLPAFERAIAEGGADGVMCAYNGVNGQPACENDHLLTDVLRDDWGYEGIVLTDWFARGSTVGSLRNRMNIQMPNPSFYQPGNIQAALDAGDITMDQLDQNVRDILTTMEEYGWLDNPNPPAPPRTTAQNLAVAQQVAARSAVLLKHDADVLPLDSAALGDLAVSGYSAGSTVVGGGGSSQVAVNPDDRTGPLEVLENRGANVSYEIGYIEGEALGDPVVCTDAGCATPGFARTSGAGSPTVDPALEFTVATGNEFAAGSGQVSWQGVFTAPEDGEYSFVLQADGVASGGFFGPPGAELRADGSQVASLPVSIFGGGGALLTPTADGLETAIWRTELTAGETLDLAVSANFATDDPGQLRVGYLSPSLQQAVIDSAAANAAAADTALVFVFNEGREFEDRPSLSLPGFQDELVSAVAAAQPDTVVVLNTGDPVLMPWADEVAGIVQMWYPGIRGAEATVDVLTGVVNPGGKLPVTFARDGGDYPATAVDDDFPERYPPSGNPPTVTYSEGIFVGYRWFDEMGIDPLYEFGHGLSYTDFRYGNLRVIPRPQRNAHSVVFTVTNTGDVAGSEVPQVYLGPPRDPAVEMAPRALVGFDRVHLAPGERATVSIEISERDLSYWSEAGDRWVLAGGKRPVYVGSSSRDIRLAGETSNAVK